MTDDADRASKFTERELNNGINFAREAAAAIPEGNPGICEICDTEKPRLVNGVCAPCRDKYKLG